jgi:hypothetical protein
MDIDPITALEALREAGIHTARSEIVDSPEEAIAFARRRDALDARLLPIVLRAATPLRRAELPKPLQSEGAIRAAFPRVRAQARLPGAGVLAQSLAAHGTDIEVRGSTGSEGRVIETGSGGSVVRAKVPLDAGTAKALAAAVRRYGHVEREHVVRMLEHVLLRLSRFFASQPDLGYFRVRFRLHDNAALAFDAELKAERPLVLAKRLESRAHDRKADEYRSSGRQ